MLAVTQPVEAALKKRCDAWHLRLDKMSFEREGGPEAKTLALQVVCSSYTNQRTSLQTAAQARLQWLDALKRQHGDRFGEVTLVLESRLLLHLGRANVLENVGLYCDRTTGLPLIPGTALKGVVSTWACWAEHFNPKDGSFREFNKDSTPRRNFTTAEAGLAQRILGDDSSGGSEHAGDLIFVGGFPTEPGRLPRLETDIVTPHPDNGRGRILPNVFLAWSGDVLWRFVFLARPGASNAAELLDTTKRWLTEALTTIGLGAKTAAGYGRFRMPTAEEQARIKKLEAELAEEVRQHREQERKASEIAQLPPEERAYAEYVSTQKDWVAAARDIASKPEQERLWILRHFRTAAGQALLKTWTNEKGMKRIGNLKAAGL